ncbi:MAG: hypothetical protein J2P17_34065, partial [Mycobacterium sp.]|nr:hypothetical protein [Mycobacterium sp.]
MNVRRAFQRRMVAAAGIAILTGAGLVVPPMLAAGPALADASTGSGGQFIPVQGRILDTRSGTSVGGYTTPMPTGTWRTVQVTGALADAIPSSGVAAVALNFTAMNPSADGYLHADKNEATPNSTVSYLHWNAGATESNSGVVAVGTDGKIQVQATSSTDLLIDVQG